MPGKFRTEIAIGLHQGGINMQTGIQQRRVEPVAGGNLRWQHDMCQRLAIAPLQGGDALERWTVFQPKLVQLCHVRQTVKIGVPNLDIGHIGLDQSVGGRGHLFHPAKPRADQRP